MIVFWAYYVLIITAPIYSCQSEHNNYPTGQVIYIYSYYICSLPFVLVFDVLCTVLHVDRQLHEIHRLTTYGLACMCCSLDQFIHLV